MKQNIVAVAKMVVDDDVARRIPMDYSLSQFPGADFKNPIFPLTIFLSIYQ